MLRELQTVLNKNTDAMFKAGAAMITGMGVVKNYTSKEVEFPAAETDNFFFVNKERVPEGEDAGRGELSDYHDNFNNIRVNEFVKLVTPLNGERYAVDQVDATGLTEGDTVALFTDGKFKKSTNDTKLIYGGAYDDAGHTLHIIEING